MVKIVALGSSRKYPYPYHGWHFGIPNAWGGGVLCPGILNAQGGGGLLGLEFLMHEGVYSPGIPKGGGKNSDLLTSEVWKTSLVCAHAEQTEPQRYDYEVGMHSLFRTAMKRLLSTVVPVVF